MISPTYTIQVDDRELMLHVDQLPMALRTALRPTITALTGELLARVRSMEPRRTGQLQSLTRSFVDESETKLRGRVRVLAPPGQRHNIGAAALEYGAHRLVSVRSSRRGSIAVAAYGRRANITAQRFLRDPAAAMRERALTEIKAAVDEAARIAGA